MVDARWSRRARRYAQTAPTDYARIGAIGFSAARETFALFDEELRPLTTGILWSDSRAEREAASSVIRDEFRAETGVVLNARVPRREGRVGRPDHRRLRSIAPAGSCSRATSSSPV